VLPVGPYLLVLIALLVGSFFYEVAVAVHPTITMDYDSFDA
jgi:hypothetical protein